jgi:hypothetical protein
MYIGGGPYSYLRERLVSPDRPLARRGTLGSEMAEDANAHPSPAEQISRLYEELEAQGAKASEQFVAGSGFATLLARVAENVAAVTKLSGDAMDIVLRNLRVAGRRDITSLARQLARTEDKLERLLQEVEELRDETARAREEAARAGGGQRSARGQETAPGRDEEGRTTGAPRSPSRDGRAGRAAAARRKESS